MPLVEWVEPNRVVDLAMSRFLEGLGDFLCPVIGVGNRIRSINENTFEEGKNRQRLREIVSGSHYPSGPVTFITTQPISE